MTIRARMLMVNKEARNRKQEIDRQHHTIPNQRLKDKHYGIPHTPLQIFSGATHLLFLYRHFHAIILK